MRRRTNAPDHWTPTRLRHVLRLNPSKTELGDMRSDTEVSFLPMEAIGEQGTISLEATRPLSEVQSGYSFFRDGDVAVAKITPCFENGKGALMRGLLGGVGFGTTELIVARPTRDRIVGEYLLWLFQSREFRGFGEGAMYGAGGQKRVPDDFVRDFRIALPPLSEQAAIAAFLNRETGKIDALVEEQRRLIELLKEKRKAVISKAVTKGLNPNTSLKPSGVEWLGEVPAHWTVTPLMRLTAPGRDIMYGIVLPGPNVEVGVPIVKGGDVRPHRLRLSLLNRTTEEIEAPFARARLRPNDVVYSIRGTIGDAELVPDELLDANITQDVARVSPRRDLCCRWLLYALKSDRVFVQLEQRSLGAAVRGINIYDLKRARVPVPPRLEQEAIAAHLDRETARLDALIDQAVAAVGLLVERRAALISAAVTGKIDIREVPQVPSATSDRDRVRMLVAAEIIERLSHKKAFGRVKLQKLIYLAEVEANVVELQGKYLREAAGPLDRELVADLEAKLQQVGHVAVEQLEGRGSPVMYRVSGNRGAYHQELIAGLGERAGSLAQLITVLEDLDTRAVEAITTLYAVWNDLLLDGQQPTEDEIVSGLLNDWHPEKRETFRADELHTWVGWMRRNKLVPAGSGPRTHTGRLLP